METATKPARFRYNESLTENLNTPISPAIKDRLNAAAVQAQVPRAIIVRRMIESALDSLDTLEKKENDANQ